MRRLLISGTAMLLAAMVCAAMPVQAASAFADLAFAAQWKAGEAVTPNFWGPLANARAGQQEAYKEAPGGQRLVQYFDKGRMELTNGTVTNGLLATEIVTGQIQVGDASFQPKVPPAIPIAGDPDNPGPTYQQINANAATLLAPTPSKVIVAPLRGEPITRALTASGTVTTFTGSTGHDPVYHATYDRATQHNVGSPFVQYRLGAGVATIGLAISEPFWSSLKVAGQQAAVLVQVFERRVLTYTPDNPPAFQVEMGNIGQHYNQWRYGTVATVAPGPAGEARIVRLDDDGQTVALVHGTSFVLALDRAFDWHVQIADEAIVSRDQHATPPPESQGVYRAQQPGQTTLTATGDSTCYHAVPRCLAPSRRFRITVVVT